MKYLIIVKSPFRKEELYQFGFHLFLIFEFVPRRLNEKLSKKLQLSRHSITQLLSMVPSKFSGKNTISSEIFTNEY